MEKWKRKVVTGQTRSRRSSSNIWLYLVAIGTSIMFFMVLIVRPFVQWMYGKISREPLRNPFMLLKF